MDLAAGKRVGENQFDFLSPEEAEIFAHVLSEHGTRVSRLDRSVWIWSPVTDEDLEWADANAFKYGWKLERRKREKRA